MFLTFFANLVSFSNFISHLLASLIKTISGKLFPFLVYCVGGGFETPKGYYVFLVSHAHAG